MIGKTALSNFKRGWWHGDVFITSITAEEYLDQNPPHKNSDVIAYGEYTSVYRCKRRNRND